MSTHGVEDAGAKASKDVTPPCPHGPIFRFFGVVFDPACGRITGPNGTVELSRRECLILHVLLLQPGRVVLGDRVRETVWGEEESDRPGSIRAQVAMLGDKLSLVASGVNPIRIIPGVGFAILDSDMIGPRDETAEGRTPTITGDGWCYEEQVVPSSREATQPILEALLSAQESALAELQSAMT